MKIIGTTTSRAGRSRLRTVIGLIAAVVMTLSLVAPGSAGATGGGQYGGVSANPVLGALSASWWQWRISIPVPDKGMASQANCDQRQRGPVFYLSGTAGTDEVGPVQRLCTVPYGKSLFFPLINIANVQTEPNETARMLWDQVHDDAGWKVVAVNATVDDKPLPGLSIDNGVYRGCAGPERGCFPGSFPVIAPKGNIFGIKPGWHNPNIADGYYALLPPLSRGTHTIAFSGEAAIGGGPFTQDVTYTLTVN